MNSREIARSRISALVILGAVLLVAFPIELSLAAKGPGDSAAGTSRAGAEAPKFSLDIPKSWHDLPAHLRTTFPGGALLAAATKYPEPFADINPMVTVAWEEIVASSGVPVISLLSRTLERAQQKNNCRVQQVPVDSNVAGVLAAHAQMDCMVAVDGPHGRELFEIVLGYWFIPRGAGYLRIDSTTRKDERTGTRSEVEAIVKSLKLEP